jgi:hypothetical protein
VILPLLGAGDKADHGDMTHPELLHMAVRQEIDARRAAVHRGALFAAEADPDGRGRRRRRRPDRRRSGTLRWVLVLPRRT